MKMGNFSNSSVSRRKIIRVGAGLLGTSLVGKILYEGWLNQKTNPLPSTPLKPINFEFTTVEVDEIGQEVQRRSCMRKGFIEKINQGFPLELAVIPSGHFLMGSPNTEWGRENSESPQRLVEVCSFLMGRYPITQAQWRTVTKLPKIRIDLNSDPSSFKGHNLPVEQVNWEDVIEFCQRLSRHTGRRYRLPNEAEWEYACRAATKTPFYFGPTINENLANYCNSPEMGYDKGPPGDSCDWKTTQVGQYPANAFGLYDTHGNVQEWCMDSWHDSYQNAPKNANAWVNSDELTGKKLYFEGMRVIRGGSWFWFSSACRSASRLGVPGTHRSDQIGFRVVCSLE